jgi:hypothetical protein
MAVIVAPEPEDIDFTGVTRIIFNGNWVKKIWNGTAFIWPGPWEDVWRDEY